MDQVSQKFDRVKIIASVQDKREAAEAIKGSIDILDLKNPNSGSLGRPSKRTAKEVLAAADESTVLSIALGELADLSKPEDFQFVDGFHYAKVGLSNCITTDWKKDLDNLLQQMPIGSEIVAVAYADWRSCNAPNPVDIVHFAFENDLPALAIDTFDKSQGDLFRHLSEFELTELVGLSRCAGLELVFAGSLALGNLSQAVQYSPDYLAVRGALCRGARNDRFSSELLEQFRVRLDQALQEQSEIGSEAASKLTGRLMA